MEKLVGIVHGNQARPIGRAQQFAALLPAAKNALVAYGLFGVVFEPKPHPGFEGRLRTTQRRAHPGQLVADDDLLRRNSESAQPVADHLEGQASAVLAGGVEDHGLVRALDHLAQNGQLELV